MIINRSRLPMKHMLTIGLLPSVLKVGYYRWRGAKIGKGVKIGIGAVILSTDIEIGDGTTIAMATSITCVKLKIGKRTQIQSLVLIDAQEISIGNDVIISEVVSIRDINSVAFNRKLSCIIKFTFFHFRLLIHLSKWRLEKKVASELDPPFIHTVHTSLNSMVIQ